MSDEPPRRRRRQPAAPAPTDPPADPPKPPLRLEWRTVEELADNPKNWRTHPEDQVGALGDALAEVGWAGAFLFNERTKHLIDGHARKGKAHKSAYTKKTGLVPVLVGDWSEADELKILATLDPLSAMAEANKDKLESLLKEVETPSEDLSAMLDKLARENGIVLDEQEEEDGGGGQEVPEQFNVLVECASEEQQAELLERLDREGFKCRSLIS